MVSTKEGSVSEMDSDEVGVRKSFKRVVSNGIILRQDEEVYLCL